MLHHRRIVEWGRNTSLLQHRGEVGWGSNTSLLQHRRGVGWSSNTSLLQHRREWDGAEIPACCGMVGRQKDYGQDSRVHRMQVDQQTALEQQCQALLDWDSDQQGFAELEDERAHGAPSGS